MTHSFPRRDRRLPAPPVTKRGLLIAAELFVGIGALFGGIGLIADAEGLGMRDDWLAGSAFADYRIPGLFLFVVIGGGMLLAAALTIARSSLTSFAATVMGLVLLLWLLIETAILGFQAWEQVMLVFLVAAAGFVLVTIGVSGEE